MPGLAAGAGADADADADADAEGGAALSHAATVTQHSSADKRKEKRMDGNQETEARPYVTFMTEP
jgi:hypothetical protein